MVLIDENFLVKTVIFFLVENVLVLLAFGIWFWWKNRFKIPVVILRFVGDKRRPTVMIRWGRRVATADGVGKLVMRNYKREMRDFKAEYYYPSEKGFGALITWEFKRGVLTPVIPVPKKKGEMNAKSEEVES